MWEMQGLLSEFSGSNLKETEETPFVLKKEIFSLFTIRQAAPVPCSQCHFVLLTLGISMTKGGGWGNELSTSPSLCLKYLVTEMQAWLTNTEIGTKSAFSFLFSFFLWLKLTMWFLSLWNWFVGGIWKSWEKQARRRRGCCKLGLMNNQSGISECL